MQLIISACFLICFPFEIIAIETLQIQTDKIKTHNGLLLDTITGNNPSCKSYFPRAKAIQRLDRELSFDECESIYRFLHQKKTKHRLKPLEFNSLKNDLVIVLMRQARRPEKLAGELVAMYHDQEQDSIWRDYCVQFMGRFYPMATLDEKKLLAKTMKEGLMDKSNGIPGTAMIAMNSNAGEFGIDSKILKENAYRIANDATVPDYVKLTAIQIAAELGDKRILALAKKNLNHSKNIQLKMSSIAALGTLGNASDKELLKQYALSSDIRLRTSALNAMAKIVKR